MVVGLLTVFAVVLAKGPLLKTLRESRPAVLPARPGAIEGRAGAAPASPTPAPPQGTAALPAAQPEALDGGALIPASRSYAAQSFRDPFESRLPAEPTLAGSAATAWGGSPYSPAGGTPTGNGGPASSFATQPPLRVEGVVWGGPRPKAIINGNVYGVNDVVEGVKIMAIDHRGVAVDRGGQLVYYVPSPATLGNDGPLTQYGR